MSEIAGSSLLREMTAADVPDVVDVQEPGAVLGLANVFPQDAYPFPRDEVAQRWREEIAAPGIDCYVVVLDGAVVGFAAIRGDEFLHFGTAVEHWGTGLAQRAHDAVLDRLRSAGVSRAWLRVFTGNARGRRFYEKLGWRPTGEHSQSSYPPHAELLRYERSLEPDRASVASRLSVRQLSLLSEWFPQLTVVEDLSWGLVDTVVLHVRARGRDIIVKAGGPDDHHIAREIAAYRAWVGCLAELGRAPELLRADETDKLVAATYLEGQLVQGSRAEGEAETYAQAGELLARFHSQASRPDDDYERKVTARTLRWLDSPHRIAPAIEAQLRAEISAFDSRMVTLVPTHGDWQPRNWLHHSGTVRVIDFGRADWRPAETDLARLARQQFLGRSDLDVAFVDGYGSDPRESVNWRRTCLREAVGTACWAYQVGDSGFEAQGHRMIADVLGDT